MKGELKKPNHQMDVVLALWNARFIVGGNHTDVPHVVPVAQAALPVPQVTPTISRTSDTGSDASTLFLVSCVSMKRPVGCRARDLYVSPWFTKARAYVESRGDRWFILSAEYGLLDPDAVVDPYEKTLNEMTILERRAWSDDVLAALGPRVAGVQRVVVLAGEGYRQFLMEGLRALCSRVEVPMTGLRIGEQLGWLDSQIRALA
jgi:hypothetical protein